MQLGRILCCGLLIACVAPACAADDIVEAMEAARKAYQAGDMTAAKQSLDLASQLVGQKNAESFVALLPGPLPGWKAEQAQANAVGQVGFGASTASRSYTNDKGDSVEVQITGDSALVAQFGALVNNPAIAGAMGKIIKVGSQRAIQTREGDINIVVANKFMVSVSGSADAPTKLSYAQAVSLDKLAKM